MPKPLFLHRPAGLYVRCRVPADLLGVVGSRFLVRPLRMVKGDRARLVAECMAVALSQSFDSLRKGEGVDLKKALDAARSAGSRDLTLGEVSLPNGTVFRNVQIDTDQDARQFQAMVDEASRAIAPHVVKAPVGAILPAKATPRKESLLSHQIAVHLGTGQEVVTYAALLRDFVTRRTTEVMPHSSLETYAVDKRWFDRVVSLDLQFLLTPAVTALERTVSGASALRAEAAKSEEILHLFEDENAQLIEDLRAEAEERVPERLVFGELEFELSISATTDAFVGDNPHTGQPAVSGTELVRILRKLADSIDTIPGRRLQGKSWTLYDSPGRPVGKAQARAV